MGRAFVLGDGIDTDQLAPGIFMKLPAEELAQHCLEGLRPDFAKSVKPGDCIVAGSNFGQGSSREQAAISLKLLGVSAVFAHSFARIFYRNAINIGLPAIEIAPEVIVDEGDELAFDLAKAQLRNIAKDTTYSISALPPHLLDIIDAGGLVPLLKKQFASGHLKG